MKTHSLLEIIVEKSEYFHPWIYMKFWKIFWKFSFARTSLKIPRFLQKTLLQWFFPGHSLKSANYPETCLKVPRISLMIKYFPKKSLKMHELLKKFPSKLRVPPRLSCIFSIFWKISCEILEFSQDILKKAIYFSRTFLKFLDFLEKILENARIFPGHPEKSLKIQKIFENFQKFFRNPWKLSSFKNTFFINLRISPKVYDFF